MSSSSEVEGHHDGAVVAQVERIDGAVVDVRSVLRVTLTPSGEMGQELGCCSNNGEVSARTSAGLGPEVPLHLPPTSMADPEMATSSEDGALDSLLALPSALLAAGRRRAVVDEHEVRLEIE